MWHHYGKGPFARMVLEIFLYSVFVFFSDTVFTPIEKVVSTGFECLPASVHLS